MLSDNTVRTGILPSPDAAVKAALGIRGRFAGFSGLGAMVRPLFGVTMQVKPDRHVIMTGKLSRSSATGWHLIESPQGDCQ